MANLWLSIINASSCVLPEAIFFCTRSRSVSSNVYVLPSICDDFQVNSIVRRCNSRSRVLAPYLLNLFCYRFNSPKGKKRGKLKKLTHRSEIQVASRIISLPKRKFKIIINIKRTNKNIFNCIGYTPSLATSLKNFLFYKNIEISDNRNTWDYILNRQQFRNCGRTDIFILGNNGKYRLLPLIYHIKWIIIVSFLHANCIILIQIRKGKRTDF